MVWNLPFYTCSTMISQLGPTAGQVTTEAIVTFGCWMTLITRGEQMSSLANRKYRTTNLTNLTDSLIQGRHSLLRYLTGLTV